MSDDSTINSDESLFMAEMAGVTPLKSDNKINVRKKPAVAGRHQTMTEADLNLVDVFSDAEITEECPNTLSFSRSGLQHKVLKKLRQGKHPIEHALDLHGLTVIEARKALVTFLEECEVAGIRHAIIVHGKGFRSKDKPIIKPMVNRWLRATDRVLAFHSAQPKDGGSGAIYLLLKQSKADE
jgi:DNA-nicking Smr family endonuclease